MNNLKQVTIIGVGLIGGSLAAAFQRENICQKIVGVDVNRKSLKEAQSRGIIEQGYTDLKKGLKNADLIVIAVPVSNINNILNEVQKYAKSGSLVFDVGSIKGDVIKQAKQLIKARPELNFIGGHPMAGSEKAGVHWADPDIFLDAPFILVPLKETAETEVTNLSNIIDKIGSNVKVMGEKKHDLLVGYISHLPHLIAFSLINNISGCNDSHKIFDLAAGSFNDTTRIAASSPKLWVDICISNRENLEQIFDDYLEELVQVKEMLANEDRTALYAYFQKAHQFKNKLLQEEK
ncbi:MAG TPA: prephenate dehydrogenase/arogenate dehydrogenase family protein [Halanaerobiales bacterium]|nr:prephenate dehydrogenase/arogenate dehydrogenase family protein [Halanaerobiales bacterium]